jgi:hypothetical protein
MSNVFVLSDVMLSVVMLSVIMLSVITLSVVMLCIVMLNVLAAKVNCWKKVKFFVQFFFLFLLLLREKDDVVRVHRCRAFLTKGILP